MQKEQAPHITIVVSPLRGLIMDQVQRWSRRSVKAVGLLTVEEVSDENIQGKANIC